MSYKRRDLPTWFKLKNKDDKKFFKKMSTLSNIQFIFKNNVIWQYLVEIYDDNRARLTKKKKNSFDLDTILKLYCINGNIGKK